MRPLKWAHLLPLPLLPIVCVWVCRVLRLAQGEKEEELAFGLLIGLLLDLIYAGLLLHFTKHDP